MLILLLLLTLTEREHTEQIAKARGYETEVRMPDETRCDLITLTHAIEVEWASKWKEAPAQAMMYSIWTGKKPGIILLIKDQRADKLHVLRCKMVCERLGIELEIYEHTGFRFTRSPYFQRACVPRTPIPPPRSLEDSDNRTEDQGSGTPSS